MAYLERIAPQAAHPIAFTAVPVFVPSRPVFTAPKPEFSALEWSVIRLAQGDRLSTLRAPGRLRRFIGWLTGTESNPSLANPRLEALRRMSVLSWHFGFVVPGDEVAEFNAAGFSQDQYELMVSSIRAAITSTQRNGR